MLVHFGIRLFFGECLCQLCPGSKEDHYQPVDVYPFSVEYHDVRYCAASIYQLVTVTMPSVHWVGERYLRVKLSFHFAKSGKRKTPWFSSTLYRTIIDSLLNARLNVGPTGMNRAARNNETESTLGLQNIFMDGLTFSWLISEKISLPDLLFTIFKYSVMCT